jgi:RNA polymerase sigma-70 factor (ECF subfamily)
MAAVAEIMSPPGDLETWLGAHRHELLRIARGVLRDADEAEDVVQETILRVLDRAGRARILEGGPYLARATYWNALKRRARLRTTRLEPLDDSVEHRAPLADPSWTLSVIELERAIAGLPVRQQAIIRLRFYAGLTYQEISTALSVSANTAASRCRYALAKLRRRLSRQ